MFTVRVILPLARSNSTKPLRYDSWMYMVLPSGVNAAGRTPWSNWYVRTVLYVAASTTVIWREPLRNSSAFGIAVTPMLEL